MSSSLVSARVRKRFGRAWFCGTVTEEWTSRTGTTYAHVLYDDGDEEDLEVEQARLLLLDVKALSAPAPATAAAVAQPPAASLDCGGSGKAAAGVKRRHGHALLTDYVQPGAVKTETCVGGDAGGLHATPLKLHLTLPKPTEPQRTDPPTQACRAGGGC
jgi:hypothetical protein